MGRRWFIAGRRARLAVGSPAQGAMLAACLCCVAGAAIAQQPAPPANQPASQQADQAASQPASQPANQAANSPPGAASPIAIVPLDAQDPARAPKVSGALEVSGGKAVIMSNGEITAGTDTTQVTLPRRGTLRVCASTTVKLAADTSVPAGETPGLLMGLDRGAIEASFATGRNADLVLTPSFRILIGGGAGAVEVKVRAGENGDTCIDNPGIDAPYVLVTSPFEEGDYRVQPGQRVMFQHGSLHQVIDNEREPCGCPPAPAPQGNEFPLAQSEGLTPLAPPAPAPAHPATQAQTTPPLVHNAPEATPQTAPETHPEPQATPQPAPQSAPAPTSPPAKKNGFFHRLGRFFRHIFGADQS